MASITNRQFGFAGGALAIALLFAATQPAQAQTFTVLHKFAGFPNDGRMPTAPMIEDSVGNLYGTTFAAGKFGGGIVFKLNSSGHETILHNFFAGANGSDLSGGLVRDAAGNLYGTTQIGGDLDCVPPTGCGTVFKLSPTNRLSVLQRFHGSNGQWPEHALLLGGDGNLYGTASAGGQGGAIFEVNQATGHLTYLHGFGPGGAGPTSGVVEDVNGNLWGTTGYDSESDCPSGCGSVFEYLPEVHNTIAALSFPGGAGGYRALGGVVTDGAGNFYGTTSLGGNPACFYGCGVVFKFDTTTGIETVLYTFTGLADGANPQAGVILDSSGNLYGTTAFGGKTTTAGAGFGVVFKIDTTGKETVLHTFDGTDGAQPEANLLLDSAGNLYGTTAYGGSTACAGGCGVVFKITP